MEREKILTVLLVVLVVIAAVQVFQVISLQQHVSTGAVSIGTQASSSGAASVPSNLQNLPTMVGGC
ncbi:MAG: hypothetical protein ACE5J7_05230 [Candidatus Aenigmatarchaeota archaeon]